MKKIDPDNLWEGVDANEWLKSIDWTSPEVAGPAMEFFAKDAIRLRKERDALLEVQAQLLETCAAAEIYILRAHARKLWNEHPSYDLCRAAEVAQENPPDIVLALRAARRASQKE